MTTFVKFKNWNIDHSLKIDAWKLLAGRSLSVGWKILAVFLLVTGFWLLAPGVAHAATLYWVGADGASFNSAANWASADPASCTGGGAGVPGSADIAVFDADCDSNATIAANWSVAGIDIKSGYIGTLTQSGTSTVTVGSGNYDQAVGTPAPYRLSLLKSGAGFTQGKRV